MNWQQVLQNTKGMALKAFMQQALPQSFPTYDEVLTRIAVALVTDNDLSVFGKMVNEIYEAGYLKAVGEYKSQLAKLGIQVTTKNQAENQTS